MREFKPAKPSSFFEMLLRNDDKELTEFLVSKGKLPKLVCPIRFIKEDEIRKEDNDE